MKKIGFNIYIAILVFIASFACDDMMDSHKDYTKGGEIIYAPKVDSVVFSSGNQRVLFQYWLYDAPHVKSITAYWNNGKDSIEIPIIRQSVIANSTLCDSGKIFIENLPEGSYTFSVKTKDSHGNRSLGVDGYANSFGSNYESSLSNRRVKAISQYTVDGDATIEWYNALEGMTNVEVSYTKKDGQKATVLLPSSSVSVLCPNAKTDTPFEYRTFFLPEPTAIDTFVTDWSFNKAKLPFDKSDWEIVGFSDEQATDGGGVNTIIDGIIHGPGTAANFWHSQYSPIAYLPHWAVIDMKSEKEIAMIDTYRRWSNASTKSVEYYIGDEYTTGDKNIDLSKWTKITEGIFDTRPTVNRLVLEVSDGISASGRFLLIYLRDSNSGQSTQISEISVCGRNNL